MHYFYFCINGSSNTLRSNVNDYFTLYKDNYKKKEEISTIFPFKKNFNKIIHNFIKTETLNLIVFYLCTIFT